MEYITFSLYYALECYNSPALGRWATGSRLAGSGKSRQQSAGWVAQAITGNR